MKYRSLGRTGLSVSVASLGTGGSSRVGQANGSSEEESIALIHAALDRGVNLVDTSEVYGTENIVGRALESRVRERVLVSSKASVRTGGRRRTASEITDALEASLARLGTDHIDIYHLHGVREDDYLYARDVLLPALVQHRDHGTIRAIGITEAFSVDTAHLTLARAVADVCWDVLMVGFNVLNQSARTRVLDRTRNSGIGVLGMHAVRRALSDPAWLQETLAGLAADGYIDGDAVGRDGVGWLLADSGAQSLTELAYRFCVHEPGVHSVLFGTGNVRHLDANIGALLAPPLPEETVARLRQLFAQVSHVSAN